MDGGCERQGTLNDTGGDLAWIGMGVIINYKWEPLA